MAKTKKVSKLKDDSKWAWLMLAPNIIGFLLFMLIPMVATLCLALQNIEYAFHAKVRGTAELHRHGKGSDYMGSYKKYDSVYRAYRSGGNVYFPAAGGYAGSEDRIPEILPGGILPSVDHLHGSCSDRMAVDLQSGLWPFELFSVSVRD